MKNLKLFALGLLGASVMLTSCEDDEEESLGPVLNVTLNNQSTGGDVTVEPGSPLVFYWDARKGDTDLETFRVSNQGANSVNPIPTSIQGNSFPYDIGNADDEQYLDTIAFNAGMNQGVTTYDFEVTDRDGNTESVSFDVTVEDAGTPMATEVTGAFFHIFGSNNGAYDLVNEQSRSVNDPSSDKDMLNTDLAGETFTGSWEADNSTMFVKDNSFNYANATIEGAEMAYNNGTASGTVDNPANGDIYIARLRGGSDYAVINVTDVDPDNNECNCGNTGKISFDFKKE